jgi:hypothetical protein
MPLKVFTIVAEIGPLGWHSCQQTPSITRSGGHFLKTPGSWAGYVPSQTHKSNFTKLIIMSLRRCHFLASSFSDARRQKCFSSLRRIPRQRTKNSSLARRISQSIVGAVSRQHLAFRSGQKAKTFKWRVCARIWHDWIWGSRTHDRQKAKRDAKIFFLLALALITFDIFFHETESLV